jgi:hypothetical protein
LEKKYIDDNIWYIDNFISQEEIDIILKECNKEENWPEDVGTGHWKGNIFTSTEKDTPESYWALSQIGQRITELIDNDEIEVAVGHNVQRFPHSDEEAMGEHHDKSTPYTTHGVVLYFNDNFDGGEIYYPNKGISLKPVPGRLICHLADYGYEHLVQNVKNGTRYVCTFFVHDKKWEKLSVEEQTEAWKEFRKVYPEEY